MCVRHQVGSTLTVRGRLAFPRELGRSHITGARTQHHRGCASLRCAVGLPSPAGVGFPHLVVFAAASSESRFPAVRGWQSLPPWVLAFS